MIKGKNDALALNVAAANLLKRNNSNHSNRLTHRNVLTVSPLAASVALKQGRYAGVQIGMKPSTSASSFRHPHRK